MITVESGALRVNRGIEEVPITSWPLAELWDIPNLLDATQPLGQVVLPQPTRIPVEERVKRIEEELRQKILTEQRAETKRAQEAWRQVSYEKAAEKQASEAQWEKGYRAAQALQEHERQMAEMAAKLMEKEQAAREREQLLQTQQQLSIFRQAQRTMETEQRLIEAQRQREAMEAMRRQPVTPGTPAPPAIMPGTPLPITPPEVRPILTPAAPAIQIRQPERAIVEPSQAVAQPVQQRITGQVVQVRAPAQPARATQQAAYDVQIARMYPSAADVQAAREMQVRAAQLSDLGAYPYGQPIRRILPGRPYQISRQEVAYRQAQAQRAAQARQQDVARQRALQTARQAPQKPTRATTPVFQPMTRRAAPARPRTGLTVRRSQVVSRRSPEPQITQNIISALRAMKR